MIAEALFEKARGLAEAGSAQELAELLVEHPGLVAARARNENGPGKTPTLLHYATCMPSMAPPANAHEIAQLLIDHGAHIDATANIEGGETPLHWAASANVPKVIEVLLDAGATIDPSGGVIANATPLFEAVVFGGQEAARTLLARGAAYNLPIAAAVGRLDLVQEFFLHGVVRKGAGDLPCWEPQNDEEIAITDAFHFACRFGHLECAKWLQEQGPLLSSPNVVGATPLDDALENSQANVVEWLISLGGKRAAEL